MCAALVRGDQSDLTKTQYDELLKNGAASTRFTLTCRDNPAVERVSAFVRGLNYNPLRIERSFVLIVTVDSEELKTQFIDQITNQYRNAVISGPRGERNQGSPQDVRELDQALEKMKLG